MFALFLLTLCSTSAAAPPTLSRSSDSLSHTNWIPTSPKNRYFIYIYNKAPGIPIEVSVDGAPPRRINPDGHILIATETLTASSTLRMYYPKDVYEDTVERCNALYDAILDRWGLREGAPSFEELFVMALLTTDRAERQTYIEGSAIRWWYEHAPPLLRDIVFGEILDQLNDIDKKLVYNQLLWDASNGAQNPFSHLFQEQPIGAAALDGRDVTPRWTLGVGAQALPLAVDKSWAADTFPTSPRAELSVALGSEWPKRFSVDQTNLWARLYLYLEASTTTLAPTRPQLSVGDTWLASDEMNSPVQLDSTRFMYLMMHHLSVGLTTRVFIDPPRTARRGQPTSKPLFAELGAGWVHNQPGFIGFDRPRGAWHAPVEYGVDLVAPKADADLYSVQRSPLDRLQASAGLGTYVSRSPRRSNIDGLWLKINATYNPIGVTTAGRDYALYVVEDSAALYPTPELSARPLTVHVMLGVGR